MAASAWQVMAGGDQRVAVGELDAVDPFERQHAPRGAAPVDLGDEEAAFGDQVGAQFGGRGRLLPQVELAMGPLPEGGDDEARAQPRRLAAHPLDPRRRPFIGLDRARRNPPRYSGRSTLIATSRPSVVTARWTCAIEAAPTGTGSIEAKSCSIGLPRPCSIAALIASNGAGGRLSCSKARSRAASSPTRSGRVASAWPNLIAAGPIA